MTTADILHPPLSGKQYCFTISESLTRNGSTRTLDNRGGSVVCFLYLFTLKNVNL
jgi:hypothetical protein